MAAKKRNKRHLKAVLHLQLFGWRPVRPPCAHALSLKCMRTKQTRTSPTKTTKVEVGLKGMELTHKYNDSK